MCLIRLPFGWDAAQFPLRGPLEYLGYDGGAGLGSGPGMAVGGALALLGRERPVENRFIGQTIDGPPVDLPAMALAQGFTGGSKVSGPEALPAAMKQAVEAVAGGGRYLLDVHIRRG